MELSIVILNYNASVFLELCVESVTRATKNIAVEIIVADNDSTDDSIARLTATYKNVKVLRLDDNYGFSKGNNIAVEQARGEFICLVNPDVIVGENVFESCLAFAKVKSKTGFIGIKLIDGKGNFLPESKRRVPKPWNAMKKLLGFSSSYYDNRISENQDGETEILVGAFMLGRKSVYQQLGGLDERYFMYGEDIDLSYTTLQQGYQNYYLGSLKAIHFKGESTIKDTAYKERFYGAMSLFYDKHYPKGKIFSGLLKYVLPKFSRSKKPEIATTHKDQQQLLVTEDPNFKPDWATEISTFDNLNTDFTTDAKIIWDVQTLEVDKVIHFMEQQKESNLIYRFLTADRSAFAGSDSSHERGEVQKL